MQIVEFFGFVEGTFEIMFPFLENLKDSIEAEISMRRREVLSPS